MTSAKLKLTEKIRECLVWMPSSMEKIVSKLCDEVDKKITNLYEIITKQEQEIDQKNRELNMTFDEWHRATGDLGKQIITLEKESKGKQKIINILRDDLWEKTKELSRLNAYCDELASYLEIGILPADVENLRNSNADLTAQVLSLRSALSDIRYILQRDYLRDTVTQQLISTISAALKDD